MRRRALLVALAALAGCSSRPSSDADNDSVEPQTKVPTVTAVGTDGSTTVFLHVVPATPSDEQWERAVPIVFEELPTEERRAVHRAIDEECARYDGVSSGAWAFTDRVFDHLRQQRDAAADEPYRTVYLDANRVYAVGAVQGDHIMTEVDARCPE
ncbi:hypothetical protein [Halomarina rubra]|uniref:Lipoprotein n=1 Tax=Halomarina rubra TaxID=2071873 RepID=A0ABD6ATT2_9EURY|nr:hypothetical protein [Halomarina rubra]